MLVYYVKKVRARKTLRKQSITILLSLFSVLLIGISHSVSLVKKIVSTLERTSTHRVKRRCRYDLIGRRLVPNVWHCVGAPDERPSIGRSGKEITKTVMNNECYRHVESVVGEGDMTLTWG